MADRDAPDAGLLIDGVKRSGVGRELGPSALEYYSEQKSVFIAED
jgi:acyl-CoA reductase-like NAD-dependent aldehyde dehydrogenase